MNNDIEIWKDIKGYEGTYQVSNNGVVRSLDRTVLQKDGRKRFFEGCIKAPFLHQEGYPLVVLSLGGKKRIHRVHRLVAEAFIDNPNNLPEVNHKNSIRDDNRVENLEWCDSTYNSRYAFEISGNFGKYTGKPRGVAFNKRLNKWAASISYRKKITHIGYFENKSDAYRAYFEKFKEMRGHDPWDLKKHKTH